MERIIQLEQIQEFESYLRGEERAESTVSKYLHDIRQFCEYNSGRRISKEVVAEWKEKLLETGRAAVTVNAALAALHSFFTFAGWQECKVKYLKIQRKIFRDASQELNKRDYIKLVNGAMNSGKTMLALIMETICSTGIRVSEIKYITMEAIKRGKTDISLKGKIRTILIPKKLVRKLQKYAKRNQIEQGEIFRSKNGKSYSRKQIWSEMKKLSKIIGIEPRKVFPHNLRHLFAKSFYQICHDIVKVADVLGHSSIETTRIYLIATGNEHMKQLEQLKFVL